MNPRYVRRFAVIGAVCAIFLLLACGVGGKAANQLPPPTPSPTVAVPTVPPAAALQLNPTASAVKDDIAVHITGLDDAMPPTTLPTIGFNCDDHLAFTHDSVTAFSASDAENIWAYLRQTPVSQNGYPTPLSAVPLPATLQWIAGGATCHARFEISNQSSQPNRDVVIVSLGLQFTATTTANQFAYAQFPLVDLCSVISANYCSYPSGAPDDIYQADVTLGDGTNGTSVPAAITSFVDPVNYPLPIILKPGDSRSIDVNISPPHPQTNAIYHIVPLVTINDGAVQTLTYDALPTTLVYSDVDPQHEACFGVLQSPYRVALDSQIPTNPAIDHSFCW